MNPISFLSVVCSPLTALLLMNACAPAAQPAAKGSDLPMDQLTWHGRYALDAEKTSAKFAWTGSGFSLRFKGTSCEAQLASIRHEGDHFPPEVFYELVVDNGPARTLAVGGDTSWVSLAAGLRDTVHTLSLRRRTETLAGISYLQGLRLNEGGAFLSPPDAAAYALFIGNSITCGYGNEGDSASCHFEPATENGRFIYATVAAEKLGLDAEIVAYSGRGMIRNYDRSTEGLMPELWNRCWGQIEAPVWNMDDHPAPALVCINIGTNDFAHSIPDRAAFVNTYASFVKAIRKQYPEATVVLLTGSMMGGKSLAAIKSYLDEVKTQSGNGVYRFDLTQQGPLGIGCDYHPNLAQHAFNGEELGVFLQEILH